MIATLPIIAVALSLKRIDVDCEVKKCSSSVVQHAPDFRRETSLSDLRYSTLRCKVLEVAGLNKVEIHVTLQTYLLHYGLLLVSVIFYVRPREKSKQCCISSIGIPLV